MERPTLKAEKRDLLGKHVKYLRAEGKTPAVVYGHGVEPVSIVINRNEFDKVYRYAGMNTVVILDLGTEKRNVLIHEPQLDPLTSDYQHVDFYQVRMDEKTTAEVPLHFVGESDAVKELEGTLITNLTDVEVECLPLDLPHNITVDISVLKTFDDAIHVKDLKVAANVEILTDAEEVVALVNPPRSEEELAALDEAPVEDVAAVAVEGEEKAEGEEGTEGEAANESAEEKKEE